MMYPYCSLELVIQKIGNLRKSYSPNICIDQPNIPLLKQTAVATKYPQIFFFFREFNFFQIR